MPELIPPPKTTPFASHADAQPRPGEAAEHGTATAKPEAPSARRHSVNENKLVKRLLRETGKAIGDYAMIEDGDRVMVCLSGGKDSYGLLDILLTLRERAPIDFEIIAVNLDQKQPGFPEHVLPDYLSARGIPFHIENQDTYSVVKRLIPEGKTTCSLCSRLRRGILYRVARELGATKIALGHHRNDILATFFLNLFYGGRMKAMPPKLVSDNGEHVIIRPLAYVHEKDLIAYAKLREFPIIPCNLCGSQENLKRKEISRMLEEWDRHFTNRTWNIFRALSHVVPSHLMDPQLMDFRHLRPTGKTDADGDRAFDEEDFPAPAFSEDDDDAHDALTQASPRGISGPAEQVIVRPRIRPAP